MPKTPKVSVRIPQKDLDEIDQLIPQPFADRSFFIRTAIQHLLRHYEQTKRARARAEGESH